ncbi:MAG: S9 family peptidase [Alphaproteobacteria bacterium]|nr:S9 family peptidase [Alphaproteobacteria bacterium]
MNSVFGWPNFRFVKGCASLFFVFLSLVPVLFVSQTTRAYASGGKVGALIDYYGQGDKFIQASLSPEGTKYSLWRMHGSQPQAVVKSTSNQVQNQTVVFDLPTSLFNWQYWLDEDRLIISVTKIAPDADVLLGKITKKSKRGSNPSGLSREFYIADTRSGLVNQILAFPLNIRLANEADDFLHRLPEDPDHFLASFSPDGSDFPGVYKVNVTTGQINVVAQPEEPYVRWAVDRRGNPRLATGWGENRFQIKVRPDPSQDWADISDQPMFESARFAVQGFSENGEDLFLISSLGKGRQAIYRYSLVHGMVREKIFEHPEYDAGRLILGGPNNDVLAAIYADDMPRLEIFDEGFRSHNEQLKVLLGTDAFLIEGISQSGGVWAVSTFAANEPSKLYLYEPASHSVRELESRLVGAPPVPVNPVRAIEYFSRDGLEIPGYLTLPSTFSQGQTVPMIVMPHGGPWVRDMMVFDAWAQYLASLGYGVLQPNFRGSSGFGDMFESRGYGQWGRMMQDDVSDAASWLVREGYTRPDTLCILGASYGGYAALMAATRNDGKFQCAISIAPVSDIAHWLRTISSSKAELKAMSFRTFGDDSLRKASTVSPASLAKKVQLPVLLVHGTADIRVSPYHSMLMEKGLRKSKKSYDVLWLEQGSHFILQEAHRRILLENITQFLEQHLPVASH